MNRAGRLFLFSLAVSGGALGIAVAGGSVAIDVSAEEVVPGELERDRAEPGERHGTRDVAKEEGEAPNEQAALLTDEEHQARSRERSRQRVELMTTTAAGEAVDPDWAPAMERRIAERFAANAPSDFKLRSASCKTSLCIAEIETPSDEASIGRTGWPRYLGFKRGYVHHRGEEGGSFRTVVFIARDGHRLPASKRESLQAAVSPRARPEPTAGRAGNI
ncbi:hypothetical protein [Nannocystis radixulma]|uniref:Uncharacterized protein n=1 Tax=Nannocystis radixulma TaxID=2995305 RepID=A0ABT5B4H8_9BACT|nr:hypothetical protein [Nannocystis radixulma]MDC0669030.1 hypothetical protein [Nannocystis radixulma]